MERSLLQSLLSLLEQEDDVKPKDDGRLINDYGAFLIHENEGLFRPHPCGNSSMAYGYSRLEEARIDARRRLVKQELEAGRLKFSPANASAFSQVKKDEVGADPTSNKGSCNKINNMRGNNMEGLINNVSTSTGIANGAINYLRECSMKFYLLCDDDQDEDQVKKSHYRRKF